MQSEIENSAHLYGGMHDGDDRIITPRDLEYGSVSLLWTGPGRCEYRVTTYRFDGKRNVRGQHRLVTSTTR